MILFMEDFYKPECVEIFGKPIQLYPTLHQNTRNSSFVRTSMILKKMGIKNYMFPLALYQKELMDVDPFDYNNLTQEDVYRIAIEIKINPWYYFREIVRIPTTGSKPISYILNRGNTALNWCFYANIDIGLVQPRQTGKTMSTQALISQIFYFTGYNFDISMLTKDSTLVQDNVARLKDIRDSLPYYLLEKSKEDTERKEGLSYEKLQNKYLTFTNSNDPAGAGKIGRGMTSPVQHWDEIAYFKYIWITFPAAIAATTAAAAHAAEAGLPCSNIMTTTAGRPDTDTGKYALDTLTSACKFSEKLYDCKNKEELIDVVTKNSKRGKKMVYCSFSHRQLGYDDEWLRNVTIRANATSEEIDRDYLNIWRAGSDFGAIDADLLAKMNRSLLEPLYVDIKDGYMINWYISESMLNTAEYKNRSYIAGMDSSELIGSDYTTLVMIDPYDMGVVATFRCNESNIINLAKRFVDLMLTLPKLVLVPECKSTGIAIIDYIISMLLGHGINPWTRIFNLAVQKKDEPEFRDFNFNTESCDGSNKRYFGFRTSAGNGLFSRNILYKTVMNKTLKLNHSRIYDELLIKEFCELEVKNGKIDHKNGGHDDLIISYLLACYLVFFGKNLHLYGIDDEKFLNKLTTPKDNIEKSLKEEQMLIRAKIKEFEVRVKNAPSELIKLSYEREINNLSAMINNSLTEISPIAKTQVERDHAQITDVPRGITEDGIRTLSEFYVPVDTGANSYRSPLSYGNRFLML